MTPNDPLYASQWHFPLLGDIETVWSEFTGAGVTVAVYDDGVQYVHTDLDENYDDTQHFSYFGTSYDPMPLNQNQDGHGTSVAGIIAAEANGEGGVGVAYDATLTGINLIEQLTSQSTFIQDAAWRYGANFDIMSNSWGYNPNFSGQLDLGDAGSTVARMMRAIDRAVDTGRDDRGTVFVIAAGNESTNAGGSGMIGARQTIAVGATDQAGDAQWYSNWGSSLLVTAPAAAVTTDLLGLGGYDGSDYVSDFGGTSASTPVVSGVVALMLEANPDLGWRDVQNILALSASQTGSAFGGPANDSEVAPWMSNGATNWNGGGLSYHLNYGFGMVDAFAAVRMAEAWSAINGTAQISAARTSANEQRAYEINISESAINDFSVVDHSVQVDLPVEIEHIIVNFTITHDDLNALHLSLLTPSGELIPVLLPQSGNQIAPNLTTLEYSIGVTSALGMSSIGTWTLRVEDRDAGDEGYLSRFSLELFGQTADNDDVFHFTQDFAELAAVDTSRKSIEDDDGGIDWLNLSAFQSDVAVNLNNGNLSFDGKLQASIVKDSFENIMTGDGNDLLVGDATDNRLFGQRGNDSIWGNQGLDVLEGGAGDDTLRGNGQRDKLFGGVGADVLYGGKSRDRLEGGAGNDSLFGGQGRDNLRGGKGDDALFGEDNHDILRGGIGNDTLDGGSGNDFLMGNLGADNFVFGVGHEQDLIEDFTDNVDTLVLDTLLWAGELSMLGVLELAHVTDGNLIFDFGGGDILTLKGITDASVLLDDLVTV